MGRVLSPLFVEVKQLESRRPSNQLVLWNTIFIFKNIFKNHFSILMEPWAYALWVYPGSGTLSGVLNEEVFFIKVKIFELLLNNRNFVPAILSYCTILNDSITWLYVSTQFDSEVSPKFIGDINFLVQKRSERLAPSAFNGIDHTVHERFTAASISNSLDLSKMDDYLLTARRLCKTSRH